MLTRGWWRRRGGAGDEAEAAAVPTSTSGFAAGPPYARAVRRPRDRAAETKRSRARRMARPGRARGSCDARVFRGSVRRRRQRRPRVGSGANLLGRAIAICDDSVRPTAPASPAFQEGVESREGWASSPPGRVTRTRGAGPTRRFATDVSNRSVDATERAARVARSRVLGPGRSSTRSDSSSRHKLGLFPDSDRRTTRWSTPWTTSSRRCPW